MAAEIKNLDTDLQMLVYENYNKFIGATDTIRRMKTNIVVMESNMEKLLEKIMSVQAESDRVNTSLFEKRGHIEKLNRTRNLLRQVQFIYDLPTQLTKCIKTEAYGDAVRYYTGAMPILEEYGDSSFQDCKRESEAAISQIVQSLEVRLSSDSEPVEARAEAVVLLKQLGFPVDSLKTKLLEEKLDHFVAELQKETKEQTAASDDPAKAGYISDSRELDSSKKSEDQASIGELANTVRAYRVIFPDSEGRLIEITKALFSKRFEATQQDIKSATASDLLTMLRIIWTDVTLMDEVLPEAALCIFSLEAIRSVVNQYITNSFTRLLHQVSDALTKMDCKEQGKVHENLLQIAFENSKKAVMQGSMDLLSDFQQLLDENLEVLAKLKDSIIDWVQEGFQDFFKALNDRFVLFCGSNILTKHKGHNLPDGIQGDQILAGLVLVIAQLSVFIEQSAIPKITEEIAAHFSGGGTRDYEDGPAFVPTEICRIFRSSGEKFLHKYVNVKMQKISVLLKKRITTPNWIKHKEPREVHMFVDLLLQELQAAESEVKQILVRCLTPKHHRTDSTGSTNSSRSNPLRDDKINRSNTQQVRSQLLESHLAKLLKQKMEIFTKIEYTQESVISTIVKLCLKSFVQFVRLQTFNRSGFQQIQLDIQFLRASLKEIADDDAAIDFLLDEVCVAAAERCLDPIPLEPAILEKLIQAKLSKT
ncbi:unnamed protein product [Victoria cruziana]